MKTRYLCVAALLLLAVGAPLVGQDSRGTMLGQGDRRDRRGDAGGRGPRN